MSENTGTAVRRKAIGKALDILVGLAMLVALSLLAALATEVIAWAVYIGMPAEWVWGWQARALFFWACAAGTFLVLLLFALLVWLSPGRRESPSPVEQQDVEDEDWRLDELVDAAREMLSDPSATHAKHRLERAMEGIEG
jgi:type VI protein secretion system component VasK